jgi:hypothetical protein
MSTMNAEIKKELAELKAAVAELKVMLSKPKAAGKAKKAVDPDAPKKEPNVWIKFTQRVGALIKAEHPDEKGPATIGKQFCSFLKEKKAYDLWEDAEILEAYAGWERPEVSKMELAGKTKKGSKPSSSATSEASSVAEEEEGAKKPRKPQSEETKAAAAVKRAATKAKKAAEAAEEAVEEAEEAVEEAPKPAPKAKEAKAKAPKAEKPAAPKVEYSIEQLSDFDSFTHEGVDYGRNARGDVVNGDGAFVGHWNGKTVNKKAIKPSDWAEVEAAMSA